ncbi:hypothetical protein KI387_036688, partial [Taxus chinensis]
VSIDRDKYKGHKYLLTKALGIIDPSISSLELSMMVCSSTNMKTLTIPPPHGMILVTHYDVMLADWDYYVDLIIKNYLDATLYVDYVATKGEDTTTTRP